MAHYRLNVQIKQQCDWFLRGFSELIKPEWVRMFNQVKEKEDRKERERERGEERKRRRRNEFSVTLINLSVRLNFSF